MRLGLLGLALLRRRRIGDEADERERERTAKQERGERSREIQHGEHLQQRIDRGVPGIEGMDRYAQAHRPALVAEAAQAPLE